MNLEKFKREAKDFVEASCPTSMRRGVVHFEDIFEIYETPDAKSWRDAMASRGWTAPTWPAEYGGGGLSHEFSQALAAEMAAIRAVPPEFGPGIVLVGPTLLEFGTETQRQRHIPKIVSGEFRWCQGYSEPGAGSDLASLQCKAVLEGDHFVINGQKIWTSRSEYSDLMILLCRTTPQDKTQKKTDGLSVLLVDMREARDKTLTIRPIRTMMNHATTEIFFDDMRVPAHHLIGEEGKGFRYILSGMNAERILIAAECIGDAKWFIEKATAYAAERSVFGRPIGQNQGVQFPIARAYAQMRAAELVLREAIQLYDAGENPGEEANLAKMLAAEASWAAAEMCVQTHGGFGFAEEYDVERKFRETRLYQVAPISTNLILSYVGEHVLGLPRSY